jgi:hypothetical protein
VAEKVSYQKVSIIQYVCMCYIHIGEGYNEGAQDSSGTAHDTCTLLLHAVSVCTIRHRTGKREVCGSWVKIRPRPPRKPRLPVVLSSSEQHPWDPIAGPAGGGRNVRLQLHVGEETFIVVITDFFSLVFLL